MTTKPIQPLQMTSIVGANNTPAAKPAPGALPLPPASTPVDQANADAQQKELAAAKLQEAQAKAQAAAAPPPAPAPATPPPPDTSATLKPLVRKAEQLVKALPKVDGPSMGLSLKLAATFAKMAANDNKPVMPIRTPHPFVPNRAAQRYDPTGGVGSSFSNFVNGRWNYAKDVVNQYLEPKRLQSIVNYSPAKYMFGSAIGDRVSQHAADVSSKYYNPEHDLDMESFYGEAASPDLGAAQTNLSQPTPKGPHVPTQTFDPQSGAWVDRTPQEFGPEMNAAQWAAYNQQGYNNEVANRYDNGPAQAVLSNITAPHVDQFTNALPADAGWGSKALAYGQDMLGNSAHRVAGAVGGIPDALSRAGNDFAGGRWLSGVGNTADGALAKPLQAMANINPIGALSPTKSVLGGLNRATNAYLLADGVGQPQAQQKEIQSLQDYAANPTPPPQPVSQNFMSDLWGQISGLMQQFAAPSAPQAAPIRYTARW